MINDRYKREQTGTGLINDPIDRDVGEVASERRGNRNRMNDIPKRTEANDQNSHDETLLGRWGPHSSEQVARRMVLRVSNDRDPSTIRTHNISLRNCVDSVVGPLAVHVGTNQL